MLCSAPPSRTRSSGLSSSVRAPADSDRATSAITPSTTTIASSGASRKRPVNQASTPNSTASVQYSAGSSTRGETRSSSPTAPGANTAGAPCEHRKNPAEPSADPVRR